MKPKRKFFVRLSLFAVFLILIGSAGFYILDKLNIQASLIILIVTIYLFAFALAFFTWYDKLLLKMQTDKKLYEQNETLHILGEMLIASAAEKDDILRLANEEVAAKEETFNKLSEKQKFFYNQHSEQLKEEILSLLGDCERWMQEIQDFSNENEILKIDNENLKKELGDLSQFIGNEGIIKDLQIQIDNLNELVASYRIKNHNLASDIQKLRDSRDKIIAELAKIKKANS